MPKGAGLTKAYKLSQDLSDIVGKKEATRGEVIKQLWAYIKEHKLQGYSQRIGIPGIWYKVKYMV